MQNDVNHNSSSSNNSQLYAQVIRAILQDSDIIGSHKKQEGNTGGQSRSYELAELLRQLWDYDYGQHQRILRENDNCTNYFLSISVKASNHANAPQKYLLQISKAEEKSKQVEESYLNLAEANDFVLKLCHGRRSVVRLSAVPEELPIVPASPVGSIFSNSCHSPSSMSNASNDSLDQFEQEVSSPAFLLPFALRKFSQQPANKQQQDGQEHPMVARSISLKGGSNKSPLFQRSGSFLKRLVRSHGRACHHMTIRAKNLVLDEKQSLPIPSLPNLQVHFALKKTNSLHQDQSNQMETQEFVNLLRFFQSKLVVSKTEGLSFTDDELNSETSHCHRRDCSKGASFYNLSCLSTHFYFTGVILEEQPVDEFNIERICASIQQRLTQLRTCSRWDGGQLESMAASFLAERIILSVERLLQAVPVDLFFPVHRSLDEQFEYLSHALIPLIDLVHLSICSSVEPVKPAAGYNPQPLIDLVHLSIWQQCGASETSSRLQSTVCKLCENCVQLAVAGWLKEQGLVFKNSQLTSKRDMDGLCELVDSLHLAFKNFGHTYEAFFDRLCFSYMARCSGHWTTRCVWPVEDTDQLVTFTKSSMKLFDALGDFSALTKEFGREKCSIQEFEPWFEHVAVFWSTSWRHVYMEFIRKCVEESKYGGKMISSSSLSQQDQQDLMAECKQGAELHDSTVNCLAFCKALCDDFLRLRAQHRSILLLGCLQITAILVDCLGSFVVQVLQQLKGNASTSKMLQTANGIEHASTHLSQNFERFLDVRRLQEVLLQEEECERVQAMCSIRHIMAAARTRCRAIADHIVESLCERKAEDIKRYCSLITRSLDAPKKSLRCYFRQVFTNEPEDQLLVFLDKTCSQLHQRLLPRLYATARTALWRQTREIMDKQLLGGQHSVYYRDIDKACESICTILQVDWSEEHSQLRRKLHINRAETLELILQYYSRLADNTMMASHNRPKSPTLRLDFGLAISTPPIVRFYCIFMYFVLMIYLSFVTDPYLRLELYLDVYFTGSVPAHHRETKKQTLNPKWMRSSDVLLSSGSYFSVVSSFRKLVGSMADNDKTICAAGPVKPNSKASKEVKVHPAATRTLSILLLLTGLLVVNLRKSMCQAVQLDVKVCEMRTDAASVAISIVIQCLVMKLSSADIAEELKRCMDAACPVGPWHVVIGEAFYSIATHLPNFYLFFCVNNLKIIAFKCREQD
uniref:MHD2 domain-containing protein n=1 Tax=Ditylenchus dipsaci TaxID=166011 RepID=A0A915EVC2_9BILA